jgi:GcrA cell cycle regulator
MGGKMSSAWDEERVAAAHKMWQAGKSASEIAAKLDCGFSRNAVIGKLTRMGLTARSNGRKQGQRYYPNRSIQSQPRHPAPQGERARTENREAERHRPPSGTLLEPNIDDRLDLDIPVEQRKTLMQLTDKTCRWPVGSPGTTTFFFCGGATDDGSPYCGSHDRRAYAGFGAPRKDPHHNFNYNAGGKKI